jgi:hypothetical protein
MQDITCQTQGLKLGALLRVTTEFDLYTAPTAASDCTPSEGGYVGANPYLVFASSSCA